MDNKTCNIGAFTFISIATFLALLKLASRNVFGVTLIRRNSVLFIT